MRLNEKIWGRIAGILLAVFIAVFSNCVCANKVPDMKLFTQTTQTLDEQRDTVLKFSASTITLSVLITFLPDDTASSLANTLSDLTKYCVLILGMIFLEKLLVLAGVPIAFKLVIPIVCCLYVLFAIFRNELFKTLATKFLVLAIALILVVPTGTYVSKTVCSEYLESVDETIAAAEKGSDKFDDITKPSNEDNQGFFSKISNALGAVVSGMMDLFDYCKGVVTKCISAVAIMIISSCVIPFATFVLFIWILNQLFQFQSFRDISKRIVKLTVKRDEELECLEGGE